ncbi:F-box only protein 6-like [Cheilinus undulatus]|uniref:F-box only protein 6-like n=1 Tax=Cheilinus undulatus TaxID=241271 RepID=UPI001BD2F150|nr:F-box only protein 6-like [Cheilinus undulatus]
MKRKANAMDATLCSNSAERRSDTDSTWISEEQLFSVPLEILGEIFLNLPPHQVVCICRLVCHQWKEVADSESLWKQRCRREGYHLCDPSEIPKDWRLFYFLCKKRRNLLKNPRGECKNLPSHFNHQKMRYWHKTHNGGDQWVVEKVMEPHPNEVVKKNFVTSYGYAPRFDCGSEYGIRVELLNNEKKPIQTFAPKKIYFKQWDDQQWHQMTHVFKNYGPGVRFIRFSHGGKSTLYWAGWYGIRVTDSSVEICPAGDT